MSPIKTVDRFLYRVVTRDLRDDHVERYIQHLAVDHEETDLPNVIGRGFPLGCLRYPSLFHDDLEKTKEAARDELILRHKIFHLCNRAAILLTVPVLLSLPVLFLYAPGTGSGS